MDRVYASSRSGSTPRLRLTLAYYVALLFLTAVAGRPAPLPPVLDQGLDVAAIGLVVLACFGRFWCSAFIAGHKQARLVTEGPYSLCRHPLYLLSLVGAVGLGLGTRSIVLTLQTVAVMAALLSYAALSEERTLAVLHGPAFEQYVATTPRWWPRWSAWRPAERIDVYPNIFRKSFLDAGAFVLLFLLIDTARTLRESGWLPTLFVLP